MIVVKTTDSRYFDEAYFVLRENVQKEKQKSTDILGEANRILAEMIPNPSASQKPKGNRWLFFAAGGICGVVLSILVAVLLF